MLKAKVCQQKDQVCVVEGCITLMAGVFAYFYKDLTMSCGQLEFRNVVSFAQGVGCCERKRRKSRWEREAWQSTSQTFPVLCILKQAGRMYDIFKATEKMCLRIVFFLTKVIQGVRNVRYSLCWSERRKVHEELQGGLSERRSNLLGVGSRLSCGFWESAATNQGRSASRAQRAWSQTDRSSDFWFSHISARFAKLHSHSHNKSSSLLSVVTSALIEMGRGERGKRKVSLE